MVGIGSLRRWLSRGTYYERLLKTCCLTLPAAALFALALRAMGWID